MKEKNDQRFFFFFFAKRKSSECKGRKVGKNEERGWGAVVGRRSCISQTEIFKIDF